MRRTGGAILRIWFSAVSDFALAHMVALQYPKTYDFRFLAVQPVWFIRIAHDVVHLPASFGGNGALSQGGQFLEHRQRKRAADQTPSQFCHGRVNHSHSLRGSPNPGVLAV